MSEVKPVAYLISSPSGEQQFSVDKPDFGYIQPLYKKEQLQLKPLVKMTQAEFDEFEKLSESGVDTIYDALDLINSDRGETDEFENIYNRLFGGDDSIKTQKNQLEFSNLWAYYNPEEPEDMIEIVSTKKWFVRSKTEILCQLLVSEKQEYTNSYLVHNSVRCISYEPLFKDELEKAINFDTKEEAEKWTNPLTESVLLPVEGN